MFLKTHYLYFLLVLIKDFRREIIASAMFLPYFLPPSPPQICCLSSIFMFYSRLLASILWLLGLWMQLMPLFTDFVMSFILGTGKAGEIFCTESLALPITLKLQFNNFYLLGNLWYWSFFDTDRPLLHWGGVLGSNVVLNIGLDLVPIQKYLNTENLYKLNVLDYIWSRYKMLRIQVV